MKDNLLEGLGEAFKAELPRWIAYTSNLNRGDLSLLEKTSDERIAWLAHHFSKVSRQHGAGRVKEILDWYTMAAQLMQEHVIALERALESRRKE